MLKAFFGRDYSMAHCMAASLVTYAAIKGHYDLAALAFFVGVFVSVVGELRLERGA